MKLSMCDGLVRLLSTALCWEQKHRHGVCWVEAEQLTVNISSTAYISQQNLLIGIELQCDCFSFLLVNDCEKTVCSPRPLQELTL